nr:unnamed protein product [Callosobruchus chinensis]
MAPSDQDFIANNNMNFTRQRILKNPQISIKTISKVLKNSKAASTKAAFENKLHLPSLPVPALNQTIEKYVKSVTPFLNEKELDNTKKLLREFSAANGIGPRLQKLLEEKAVTEENWLESWWLNTAYLEYRQPVVVYSSPGLVFPFEDFTNEQQRLQYTAMLILAALQYKNDIFGDQIPLETMGASPLDMNQYKKVFGTCRIPGEKRDSLQFNPDSRHIVVARNNHFFKMEVIDSDGNWPSLSQLTSSLEVIIRESEDYDDPVGVLTTEHRDKWNKAYTELNKGILVDNLDMASFQFKCFGKNFVKAHQLSPDSFVQMAIQLAFYRIHRVPGAQYESASTRKFIHGRTETIRSCSIESVDFAKTMLDTSKTVAEKLAALKEAINKHKEYAQQFNVFCLYRVCDQEATDNSLKLPLKRKLDRVSLYTGVGISTVKRIHKEDQERLENNPNAMLSSPGKKRARINHDPTARKFELFELVLLHRPPPEQKNYVVDRIIREHGHTPLRTPPYMCELNPIELAWAKLKFIVRSHNITGDFNITRYGCCYNPRPLDMNFGVSAFVECPETSANNFREALEDSLRDMRDVLITAKGAKL